MLFELYYVSEYAPNNQYTKYKEDGSIRKTELNDWFVSPRFVKFAHKQNKEIGEKGPNYRIVVPPSNDVSFG